MTAEQVRMQVRRSLVDALKQINKAYDFIAREDDSLLPEHSVEQLNEIAGDVEEYLGETDLIEREIAGDYDDE